MEIIETYQIKIDNVVHFVYSGTCDGIPTKWLTKSTWNGKLKIQLVDNKVKYTDTNGEEVVVFDETDVEYKYY